ncbi:MAG: hypothetical protein QOI34_365, partial [Verrucomicrobiota bacterium]
RAVSYVEHIFGEELGRLITYPLWILGIPLLFFVFGNQKIDRVIGELSYPIYLVHFIVLSVVAVLLTHFGFGREIGVSAALVSIVVACIFYRVFIAPLDRKRHLLTRATPNHAIANNCARISLLPEPLSVESNQASPQNCF